MALVVTPGASDADAYLDVDDMDARAAAGLGRFAAAWAASTDDAKKEAAIRQATVDVDAVVEYVGQLWDWVTPQALLFPRASDTTLGVPFIPESVKRATYVQAIYLFSNADILDEAATRRARGLSSFSEPNVSGSLATDPNAGRYSADLESALKPVLNSAVIGRIALG